MGLIPSSDSIQTLCIPNLYSALLGVGLVPSPFVFQGEGGGWGCFWFHLNALNSQPLFRPAGRGLSHFPFCLPRGRRRMGLFLVPFKRFEFPTFIPLCWAWA